MPRYFFPTLIALSGVTAMVLAATAVVLRFEDSAQVDTANRAVSGEVAVRAAVERFYAAVNDGIETGDTGSLGTAISLDYAEGALTGHTTSAGDEIIRLVRTLHEIVPTLRLRVTSLVAEGDSAAATVHMEGAGTSKLLGLRLVDPTFWGSSDLFRVSGDLVTERRFAIGDRLQVDALTKHSDLGESAAARRVMSAQQVVLAPGEVWSSEPVRGIRVLRIASGAPTVTLQSESSNPAGELSVTPSPGLPVAAGDSILQDGLVSITVSNQSDAPAAFVELAVARRPPSHPDLGFMPSSVDDVPEGDVPDPAHEAGVGIPAGSVTVASGRITLEPGARLAWEPGDQTVVLTVTSGTILLQTGTPASQTQQNDTGDSLSGYVRAIVAGDVAPLVPETGATIDNPGNTTAEIVVFTFLTAPDPNATGLFQRRET